jgi:hypothetical protein
VNLSAWLALIALTVPLSVMFVIAVCKSASRKNPFQE